MGEQVLNVAPRLEIRLLGRFSIRRNGREIPAAVFGGRLVRALVRMLVIRRGQFVSKDVLVEALWPERPPANPVRNLEILVVRARRALGDPSLIETGPGGYTFALDPRCEVDAERFAERVRLGRRHLAYGQFAAALAAFREAVALWGGEPLAEDAYEEWAQALRTELTRLELEALEGGAQAALEVGDLAEGITLAERAVSRDPLREPPNVLLARALAEAGDVAGALAAVDRFKDRLNEEVGVDPSPEALAVRTAILRGEPLPRLTAGHASRARPSAALLFTPPAGFMPASMRHLAFVGREDELRRIIDAAGGTGPRIVLVGGAAGTGKSRLLAEAAGRSPVPVLASRAFAPERDDAWAVIRSIVREALALDADAVHAISHHAACALLTVAPEIIELRSIPTLVIDQESRRALAFEAVLGILRAAAPYGALVLVDDLQWADATSLALLQLFASRLDMVGLGLAFRPEDVARSGPLPPALAAFRRLGADEMTLGRLPTAAIEQLVGDVDLAAALSAETDGTPFTIAEVLHRLGRDGAVEQLADGRWRRLRSDAIAGARGAAREGQQRVLAQRIQQLPEHVRPTLHQLAVIAREIPARLLAPALGRPEGEVLDDLDALASAGLARLGESGWAVAHDLIGDAVAAGVSREELARYHAHAAEVLAADGGESAEVARHLQAAGDPPAAAAAYARAARRALDRFANQEVRDLAARGLALSPDSTALQEMRGEASARLGDLPAAHADFAALLQRAGTAERRSYLLSRLAMLEAGANDYGTALALAERAIQAAGASQPARAHALAVAARIDMNLGHHARCRQRSAEALAIFEMTGDAQGIARIVDTDAIATLEEGRVAEAVPKFDRAASAFADLGELFRSVMPRATRGLALNYMGRLDEALRDIDEALDVARMLGYREGEGYALYLRADALAAQGRGEEAVAAAAEALAIAADIGHREWQSAARAVMGGGYLTQGDLDAAEREFREALALAEGMPIHSTWAASGLVHTLVRGGRARRSHTPSVRWPAGSRREALAIAPWSPGRNSPQPWASRTRARSPRRRWLKPSREDICSAFLAFGSSPPGPAPHAVYGRARGDLLVIRSCGSGLGCWSSPGSLRADEVQREDVPRIGDGHQDDRRVHCGASPRLPGHV